MTKNELRTKYTLLRQKLSEATIDDLSLQIANQIIHLDIWQHSFYHLFLPIQSKKEVNTEYILQVLAGKDKNIVLSVSDFSSREMSHFLLTDNTTIKKNEYGIPEPVDGLEVPISKINVVFVPLLAYDEKGHRVGYGKGFYDQFLSKCQHETLKIGLSFFEAEIQIEDIFSTDISLDYCITPTRIYNF
jgi:5-formyltetrahydrofolate cyclo-ligase